MFEVNYHAWVQNGDVYACIKKVFDDSLLNQSKMGAHVLGMSIGVMIWALVGILYI
jgi:hypothetical protein